MHTRNPEMTIVKKCRSKLVSHSIDRHGSCSLKMLYLIGLGLADETDITVKGLEVVKRAERVYLEAYTSILLVEKAKLVSAHISVYILC